MFCNYIPGTARPVVRITQAERTDEMVCVNGEELQEIAAMCGGMKYVYTGPETGLTSERKVFFPLRKVLIPALGEEGECLYQWGRRKEETDFDIPVGGWARLESLEKPYWQCFNPAMVLIPALEFSEKPEGFDKSLWYPPMRPGTFLMGLKLVTAGQGFVYVVTVHPNRIIRNIDRVPVIVNRDFEPHEELELPEAGQMGLF